MIDMDEAEGQSIARIETARHIHRQVAAKCAEHGVTVEEAAIAAIFAAYDIAEPHAGHGISAVEWLRTSCDLLERAVFVDHRLN